MNHSARPKLLDLCCCAGGAAMGYWRAGFDVYGVDTEAQPNYPFWFQKGDALTFPLDGFDAVHASPPCQGYSAMSTCRPGLADKYPKLIGPLRDRFVSAGIPYVIENVEAAKKEMVNPVSLCGQMFGLELYRHRLFECSFDLTAPEHPEHVIPASKAGHWEPGTIMSVAGHVAPIAKAREVMGIDWTTREELAEAIPPAYTEYVGAALLGVLTKEAAA